MRKTPVLLRRGPLSGNINVLLRYTRLDGPRGEILKSSDKQDVTADFDALVMEILFGDGHDGPPCPDIVYLIDKAAAGEPLNPDERVQMDGFCTRFKKLVERHNDHGHGAVASRESHRANAIDAGSAVTPQPEHKEDR